MSEAIKRVANIIRKAFEKTVWFDTLKWDNSYQIRGESGGPGEGLGYLTVVLAKDGDVWIDVDGHGIRFRNPYGSQSRHGCTRNALIALAEAVRLDTESSVKA